MANPSKAKGTAVESAVVRYLRGEGFAAAERQPLHGAADEGDVIVCRSPMIIAECKGGKAAEAPGPALLGSWIEQTIVETRNAHARCGVLVRKRAGYGAARADAWWCHLRASDLAQLVAWELMDGPVAPSPVWCTITLGEFADLLRVGLDTWYG